RRVRRLDVVLTIRPPFVGATPRANYDGCPATTLTSAAMTPEAKSPARRGRPAAASREDVLAAGMQRYLRGRRIDVQAIGAELGLGRTTIYRWFGSREGLIGEVVFSAAEPLINQARASARGEGGEALLDTFDRLNRSFVGARALRQFVEQERE